MDNVTTTVSPTDVTVLQDSLETTVNNLQDHSVPRANNKYSEYPSVCVLGGGTTVCSDPTTSTMSTNLCVWGDHNVLRPNNKYSEYQSVCVCWGGTIVCSDPTNTVSTRVCEGGHNVLRPNNKYSEYPSVCGGGETTMCSDPTTSTVSTRVCVCVCRGTTMCSDPTTSTVSTRVCVGGPQCAQTQQQVQWVTVYVWGDHSVLRPNNKYSEYPCVCNCVCVCVGGGGYVIQDQGHS